MQTSKYFNNMRTLRTESNYATEWTATRVETGGYILHANGVPVNVVNDAKPRVFKTLEALQRYLEKLGVTEFRVKEFVVRRITKH